jgi:tetratricopeptide (TPR) repeat protein
MQQSPSDLVRDFLRGQNLEQIGKVDEAIAFYEKAVASSFDSAGPYDRLIWIYQTRNMHQDVIRIAEASLEAVRTYPEKREWYQRQIEQSREALGSAPKPRRR